MRRNGTMAGLLAACLLAAGCSGPAGTGGAARRPTGSSADTITAVHLFADPTTVNLDANPDPDGVVMTVYFENGASGQPVAVRDGQVTCMVYDSAEQPPPGQTARPLKTWRFSARQLQPFTIDSFLGTGYRMALQWGTSQPQGQNVTLVVQYQRPGQPVIAAPPVTITVIRQ